MKTEVNETEVLFSQLYHAVTADVFRAVCEYIEGYHNRFELAVYYFAI